MKNFLTLKKIKNDVINFQYSQMELINTPPVSQEKNLFYKPFSFIVRTENI